jgi:hypothetical protein
MPSLAVDFLLSRNDIQACRELYVPDASNQR